MHASEKVCLEITRQRVPNLTPLIARSTSPVKRRIIPTLEISRAREVAIGLCCSPWKRFYHYVYSLNATYLGATTIVRLTERRAPRRDATVGLSEHALDSERTAIGDEECLKRAERNEGAERG